MRLPAGRPVVVARSACDHCGKTLGPLELIPLVSYAAQRGRCRACGGQIDPIHWIAELAALALAGSAALYLSGWPVLIACGLGWTLLALAIADWRHGMLPDVLTLPLLIAGIAVAAINGDDWFLLDRAFGAVVGFGLLAVVGWTYRRLRGRIGLGFGDVKLIAAGGAWVGWQGLPSILLIGAGSALLGVGVMALMRGWSWRRRFPFGPWVCLAIWIVYLIGPVHFYG